MHPSLKAKVVAVPGVASGEAVAAGAGGGEALAPPWSLPRASCVPVPGDQASILRLQTQARAARSSRHSLLVLSCRRGSQEGVLQVGRSSWREMKVLVLISYPGFSLRFPSYPVGKNKPGGAAMPPAPTHAQARTRD
jgi:hypothetical protein